MDKWASHGGRIDREIVVFCCPLNIPVDSTITWGRAKAWFACTESAPLAAELRRLAYPHIHCEPQCGFAPGRIGEMAREACAEFDRVKEVRLYAGALTAHADNDLLYHPTWSPEGLDALYRDKCRVIVEGREESVPVLSGWREVILNGERFEAFHAGDGMGEFAEDAREGGFTAGYWTLRPVGHLETWKAMKRPSWNDGPLCETPERVIGAVTVVGVKGGLNVVKTVMREDAGIAQATAAHVVERVVAWAARNIP